MLQVRLIYKSDQYDNLVDDLGTLADIVGIDKKTAHALKLCEEITDVVSDMKRRGEEGKKLSIRGSQEGIDVQREKQEMVDQIMQLTSSMDELQLENYQLLENKVCFISLF